MSPVMEQVIYRLKNDLSFAESFLNSPEQAIKNYDLNSEEYEALIARDVQALQELGVSNEDIWAAESGAHSQTCY